MISNVAQIFTIRTTVKKESLLDKPKKYTGTQFVYHCVFCCFERKQDECPCSLVYYLSNDPSDLDSVSILPTGIQSKVEETVI